MKICDCSQLNLPTTTEMIQEINRRIQPEHTILDLRLNTLDLKSGAELALIFAETLVNHPNITTLDLSQNNLWKLHHGNTAGHNLKIAFAALPPTIKKLILSWNMLDKMNSINLQIALKQIKNHVRIDLEGNNLEPGKEGYENFTKGVSLDPSDGESMGSFRAKRYLTADWRYSEINLNTLYNKNFRKELFKTAILSFSKNNKQAEKVHIDVLRERLIPFLTIHDAANLRLVCRPQ